MCGLFKKIMTQESNNYVLQRMAVYLDNNQMMKLKNVCSITTEDIREYLSNYQIERGVCKASIDNTRRNLSSFFKWLEDENYIFKSPLRRIHKIKMTHSVKDTCNG